MVPVLNARQIVNYAAVHRYAWNVQTLTFSILNITVQVAQLSMLIAWCVLTVVFARFILLKLQPNTLQAYGFTLRWWESVCLSFYY